MNYLRAKDYNFSPAKQSGWKKPLGLAVVVLIIYLWGSAMFVDVSALIVYPYLRLSGQIDQSFSVALKSQKSLVKENNQLKTANATLRAEMLQLNNLQAENNQLRGLKNTGPSTASPILGRIIAKPNHLPYDEIIIDVGRDQVPGITPGQLIFADQEVILGQVELVTGSYSKVKLYSTSGVKIPVVVGETAVPSIAEGLGGGNFSLTLPRGVDIKVGDEVKTSIVGDYILGYVANIYKDANDPFQKIIFRSPYNIFELEWVQLLPN